MFSTSSSPEAASGARGAPGVQPRRWSIAGRLVWYYAGSTFVLLVLAVGVLYMGLARDLARHDEKLVASKMQVLRHLLTEYSRNSEALASEVEHEGGEQGPLQFYMRVMDAAGRLIIATPGMDARAPAASFPVPVEERAEAASCAPCRRSATGDLLLLSVLESGSADSAAPLVLQVALDVTDTNEVLAAYRLTLFIVMGFGLLAAALLGGVVARAAMQPVATITRRVQAITASHLEDRLAETEWPAELSGLAGEFDAMLDRLQDSFTRLTQFSADLAHALRNPINNLRGEAEVVLGRARSPEEYQQVLGSSLEEFGRLSRLIDGLLFIARAEDPHRVVERTLFPAGREVDAVCEFYEALSQERGVTVESEGEGLVLGDPVLFRRAVSNLLANALNHTPAGGRVTMSTFARRDGTVEVRVSDTGDGIAAQHLPRVFDRFYRVEDGQARDTVGAGLGLAIVRSIMRLHGGDADIQSRVGAGTTVRLVFPKMVQAPAAQDPTA